MAAGLLDGPEEGPERASGGCGRGGCSSPGGGEPVRFRGGGGRSHGPGRGDRRCGGRHPGRGQPDGAEGEEEDEEAAAGRGGGSGRRPRAAARSLLRISHPSGRHRHFWALGGTDRLGSGSVRGVGSAATVLIDWAQEGDSNGYTFRIVPSDARQDSHTS